MRRRLILDSGDPSQNRNPHHLQVATDDEVRRSVSIIKAFMTWCSTANPGTQINEEALKGFVTPDTFASEIFISFVPIPQDQL